MTAARDVLPKELKDVFALAMENIGRTKPQGLAANIAKFASDIQQQSIVAKTAIETTRQNTSALGELTGAINRMLGIKSFGAGKQYRPLVLPPNLPGKNSIDNFGRLQISINVDGKELQKFIANTNETLQVAVPVLEDTAKKANDIIGAAKEHAQRIRQYSV